MTIQEFLLLLEPYGLKKAGDGWMCKSPARPEEKTASLSIDEGDDGRILLCDFGDKGNSKKIVEILGLKWSDLNGKPREFPNNGQCKSRADVAAKNGGKRREAEYIYENAEGKKIYKVIRYADKSFSQSRFVKEPDKAGWFPGMKGIKRVLYHLPQVISAVKSGATIYVTEGEKDVHTLEEWGLAATTFPGGAESIYWKPAIVKPLKGADVVILPDNDDAGRGYRDAAGNILSDRAESVRVLDLPGLKEKGDVTDWKNAGGTLEQFLGLVETTAEEFEPVEVAKVAGGADNYTDEGLFLLAPDELPMTELGNANRLNMQSGDNMRYIVGRGWVTWCKTHWMPDKTGEVARLAQSVVRNMHSMPGETDDDGYRKAILSHIKASERERGLGAMIKLLQTQDGISVMPGDADANKYLLNCLDVTVDLRTGEPREHNREDLITKICKAAYDPQAKAGRWLQFLDEVFGGDKELVDYAQRLCGYALTGDTKEQCLFLLVGKGSNGKSVFLRTLMTLLGDYSANTPFHTFLEKRDENTCDLAVLPGARLVIASEGESRNAFSESRIKQVTGQDPISARHLYKEFFTFIPEFKLFFATNDVPRIKSQNYAMRRRIHLLPFRQRFYYEHEGKEPVRDERLYERLINELDGILAWAVEGCLKWQADGLGMPKAIREEVDALFEAMDVLGEFIEECCELHPGYEEDVKALWSAYLSHCQGARMEPTFKRSKEFSQALVQHDGIDRKRTKTGRKLSGIRLKQNRQEVLLEDESADQNPWK